MERQQAIKEQRRKIEHFEEVKKCNAAKAQVKIYDEVESIFQSQSLSHSNEAASKTQATPITPLTLFHAPNTSQILDAPSPASVPYSHTVTTQAQQNNNLQPEATTCQTLKT